MQTVCIPLREFEDVTGFISRRMMFRVVPRSDFDDRRRQYYAGVDRNSAFQIVRLKKRRTEQSSFGMLKLAGGDSAAAQESSLARPITRWRMS